MGQAGSITLKHRVVSLGQHTDEAVRIDQTRGLNAFLISGVQTAVTNVVHHGTGEQVHVLQHDAQRPAQVRLLDAGHGDAIIQNLTLLDIVEPVDEVGHGGLAGTGGADERDLLAGLGEPGDVVQHRLVRVVAEGHVGEAHVAAQQRITPIRRGDRLLLGLHRHLAGGTAQLFGGLQRPRTIVADLTLPCPVAGLVVDFGHGAAILAKFHVDERHGALVFLDGFVHQLEDAGGAGERHHHHGQLLGDLADRVDERAGQGQQGDERAEGERLDTGQTDVIDAGQRNGGTDDGEQDVEQIAHIADDRHGHIAPSVRLGGRLKEFLVLLIEGLLSGVLMVEDLDDLLTIDGLLHEGVHVADPLLLLDEVSAGTAHDLAHDEIQQNGEHNHERSERD